MKESDVQKKIIKHLEANGAWVVKVISANKNGVPDVLACLGGHFVAVEVKAPGKLSTLKPLQQWQLDQITKAGGTAMAVDSLGSLEAIMQSIMPDSQIGDNND